MASLVSSSSRDISVFSYWRRHDDLSQFASILRDHDMGMFFRSAMLVDELMTDDRIQGVTETRIGELLSSPLKINPASDKRKARKVAEELGGTDGYSGIWETIASPTTVAEMEKWGIFMGVAVASIEWDRTPEASTPRLVPWHPANLYWDDWRKVFVMNTMQGQVVLPRPDQQPEGDGKWFVWCPYGVQYGWRSGAVRSIGEIYLSRRYGKRDFNRWTETRAMGILKGKTPQKATPEEKDNFRRDLSNANSDTVVIVPQGADGEQGYDVEGVNLDSSGGTSWQGIKGLIDDANTDIAVLLLGGNLGTEVKEGSFAAAKDQRKTSVNRALRDAGIAGAISRQVLTHWADLNYDDAGLAPLPCYEVMPPEDALGEAQALKFLGEAAQALALASPRVDVEAILEGEGVPMISEEELAARMEEQAQQAAEAAAAAAPAPGSAADPAATQGDQPSPDDQPPKKTSARAALGMLERPLRRRMFQGLSVAVENSRDSIRRWTDADGRQGHTVMRHDYGFLDGYLGADKEELDVYLGPDEDAEHVFVVRQNGPVGVGGRWCFDEDKVMMGFPSAEAAKAAFLAHRDDGERAFGGIVMHTVAGFKAKLSRRRRDSTNRIRASIDGTARSLVALSARTRPTGSAARTVAGRKRAAKYQETLLENSKERAAAALAPFLAGMKAEIDKAGSIEEIRPRVLKYLEASRSPRTLALVIRGMNMLAGLHGRATAREGI